MNRTLSLAVLALPAALVLGGCSAPSQPAVSAICVDRQGYHVEDLYCPQNDPYGVGPAGHFWVYDDVDYDDGDSLYFVPIGQRYDDRYYYRADRSRRPVNVTNVTYNVRPPAGTSQLRPAKVKAPKAADSKPSFWQRATSKVTGSTPSQSSSKPSSSLKGTSSTIQRGGLGSTSSSSSSSSRSVSSSGGSSGS